MILSMTGFGKAEGSIAGNAISVNIRSLNNKQLELSSRIPNLFRDAEPEIRSAISKRVVRGKVELTITLTPITDPSSGEDASDSSFFDKEKIAQYYRELTQISSQYNIPLPQDLLTRILSLPGVMATNTAEVATKASAQEQAELLALIEEALLGFEAFRKQEGEMLERVFEEKIANIGALLEEVTPYEAQRIEDIRARFTEELAKLEGITIDNGRFEQEMIYYIEKLDVNEEKERLANHLKYFMETMKEASTQGVGKKLAFIAQEIGREINTLGSKSNQAAMQQIVVRMKDELEQIKEQVLNAL